MPHIARHEIDGTICRISPFFACGVRLTIIIGYGTSGMSIAETKSIVMRVILRLALETIIVFCIGLLSILSGI